MEGREEKVEEDIYEESVKRRGVWELDVED